MEKINYRFLNYKSYDAFKCDLDDGRIDNGSIVFILDVSCIWAHKKLYWCGNDDVALLSDLESKIGKDDLIDYATIELLDEKIRTLRIVTDTEIKEGSYNPVANDTIAKALKNKIDQSALNEYTTEDEVSQIISNAFTAGSGISIENNVISTTLDTLVFVIVDSLPEEGDQNKIYLVPDNGTDMRCYSYLWNGSEWIPMGEKTPNIDLSLYLKQVDAENIYSKKSDLTDALKYIDDVYEKKIQVNYAQVGYVNTQLENLQRIIADQYVQKRDVYTPENGTWSEGNIVPMGDNTIIPDEGGSGSNGKMITLTTKAYQALVDAGAVQNDVYYFTYEGEETTSWTFGGAFPIIFAEGDNIGTFPITLQ